MLKSFICNECHQETERAAINQKWCAGCLPVITARRMHKWQEDNRDEVRANSRTWYKKNAKKVNAKNREYNKNNKDKLRESRRKWLLANRDRKLEYQKKYREANKEKLNEGQRKWAKANPDKIFIKRIKHEYGMSKEEYDKKLLEQNNSCAICLKVFTKTPDIDHDHVTEENRGLLCRKCNLTLGYFQDHISILERAIQYLRKYNIMGRTMGKTRVRPLFDRVLVKVQEPTEVMKGGILLPDSAVEKPFEGKVIAVGSGHVKDGKRIPLDVKEGDTVVFGRYSGNELEIVGEKFLILKEDEIQGVYFEE